MTPIAGPISASLPQVHRWATAHNAHDRFLKEMVPPLWLESVAHGIDPIVVIAQAAHETGFGHYGGVVPPVFHNTCGLKTRSGGANSDPLAHEQWPSWEVGARAHVQHLCAYAGLGSPYPELTARAVWVRAANARSGIALYVEDLSTRWAPSTTYGQALARHVGKIQTA